MLPVVQSVFFLQKKGPVRTKLNPYTQCTVYLPTFTMRLNQMWVNRPYVEYLGKWMSGKQIGSGNLVIRSDTHMGPIRIDILNEPPDKITNHLKSNHFDWKQSNPGKLTWNTVMEVWKDDFLFQHGWLFPFHVNLHGFFSFTDPMCHSSHALAKSSACWVYIFSTSC